MSKKRDGQKWNREETILAFDLYCRTPFGQISSSNREIVILAELLGRTAGSVALKMHNLAHNDPEMQKRNIKAMSHGSKLDKEIVQEFLEDWEGLTYQAQLIRANMQNISVSKLIGSQEFEKLPPGEYREQKMKARIGQFFFRSTVLNAYGNQCCVTGLKLPELLIASHIKPWAVSDSKTERTNPSNGLCLNPLHDKAFDQGLITIDNKYKIIVSEKIKKADMDQNTRKWLLCYDKQEINLPDKFYPAKDFIEYHNDNIFIG